MCCSQTAGGWELPIHVRLFYIFFPPRSAGRVDDVLNVSGHRIGTAEVRGSPVLLPARGQAGGRRPPAVRGQDSCLLT